jgi:hypothetical protein
MTGRSDGMIRRVMPRKCVNDRSLCCCVDWNGGGGDGGTPLRRRNEGAAAVDAGAGDGKRGVGAGGDGSYPPAFGR